jgi:hypothetical protein
MQGCKWFFKKIPEIFWQIFPKVKSDMRFVNKQNHWNVSWMHLGMPTHKFRQLLWNNQEGRFFFTNREPHTGKMHFLSIFTINSKTIAQQTEEPRILLSNTMATGAWKRSILEEHWTGNPNPIFPKCFLLFFRVLHNVNVYIAIPGGKAPSVHKSWTRAVITFACCDNTSIYCHIDSRVEDGWLSPPLAR